MFFNRETNKKRAFTLAEVLITLTIIGVIAVMTIPSLITDYNRRVRETRLKKDYSIATNMCERMMADENAERITELDLFTQLNAQDADAGNIQGIIARYIPITRDVVNDADGFSIAMPDGSIMFISGGNNFIRFFVDVNDRENPNTPGLDQFAFNLGANCQYNADGAQAGDLRYGTFRNTIQNEWRLPREPVAF